MARHLSGIDDLLAKPFTLEALSGILQEQAEAVTAAYRPWFELAPPTRREEWVRIDGRRGTDAGG